MVVLIIGGLMNQSGKWLERRRCVAVVRKETEDVYLKELLVAKLKKAK